MTELYLHIVEFLFKLIAVSIFAYRRNQQSFYNKQWKENINIIFKYFTRNFRYKDHIIYQDIGTFESQSSYFYFG